MSDLTTIEERLSEELDAALRRYNVAEDAKRDLDRPAESHRRVMVEADAEARRLRLALFALEGKNYGDRSAAASNAANNERRRELRSERP